MHTQTHTIHTQNKGEARSSPFRVSAHNHPSFLPSPSFWALGPRPALVCSAPPHMYTHTFGDSPEELTGLRNCYSLRCVLFPSSVREKHTSGGAWENSPAGFPCSPVGRGGTELAYNFQHQNAAACGQYFCPQKPDWDSESRFLMEVFINCTGTFCCTINHSPQNFRTSEAKQVFAINHIVVKIVQAGWYSRI